MPSFRMGLEVQNQVGVTGNNEVEAPVAIDAGLPNVACLIVFLGAERRVAQIVDEESGLFVERLSNGGCSVDVVS
jgi:hypothetical protein